jgi:hypothetical protein
MPIARKQLLSMLNYLWFLEKSRSIVLGTLAGLAFLAFAPGSLPPGGGTASAAIYWGATMKGEVYGIEGEAPKNPAVWERFEHDAGKKVTIVNTGQSWGQFDTTTMQQVIDGGAIPLVTMGITSGVTMQEVAEGKQDTQIRAWAKSAKAFGYPFMFRPWREMNGAWYSWGRDPHFVDAWRHFHDVVVEEGATNVTWAWIVNTVWLDAGSDPTPYYPGDQYVDWVGIDAYNWGRNPIQPDTWLSPEQAIDPTLQVLEKITDKPVVLTEVASSEYGGNKASWIRDFLGSYLPNHPNIKAMIWFNWNILQDGLRYDWPIESSITAEQAFRDGIQSSEYLSQRPPLTPLTKVPMPPAWSGPAQPLGTSPGPTLLSDGIWRPATELGAGGGDEREAQLAVGPDGTTTAVWEHYDGSHFVIQERRIGRGGAPLGPVNQLSAGGRNAFDPRVAVGPDGVATVVWKRYNGTSFAIQERRVDAGGTPATATHDLSLSAQFAGQPEVAARPDGGAVVVWERHITITSTSFGFNFSRDVTRIQSTVVRPDGSVAACCFDLTDGSSNSNGFEPQVAVAPDSTAIVVWDRHNGSEQVVQARQLAVTGSPSATTYDISASGENAIEPDVAFGSDGTATVAWTRFDGSEWVVQARRLATSGSPASATVDVSEAGGAALQPRVAVLSNGAASIVWKQLGGSTYAVKERRLGSGGLSPSVRTLSPTGGDGSETVVWALDDGSGRVVQARRVGADGTPAADTVDLSPAGVNVSAPVVAAGGGSAVSVAWRRFDGLRDRLQVAAFGLPTVSIDPGSQDFGTRVVASGPSQPRSFTIGNPGSTALTISSIALQGAGAGQFHLQDPSSCASATLAPGQTCQVQVTFDPTATGGFQAELKVDSNASTSGGIGTVQGTGVNGTASAPISGSGEPSNEFRLGRIKLDRKRGTARLEVWVPGAGSLRLGGRGVTALPRSKKGARAKSSHKHVSRQGPVFFTLGATGKAQKTLSARSRVKLRVQVSYLPDGGTQRTKSRTVRLRLSPQPPSRRGR